MGRIIAWISYGLRGLKAGLESCKFCCLDFQSGRGTRWAIMGHAVHCCPWRGQEGRRHHQGTCASLRPAQLASGPQLQQWPRPPAQITHACEKQILSIYPHESQRWMECHLRLGAWVKHSCLGMRSGELCRASSAYVCERRAMCEEGLRTVGLTMARRVPRLKGRGMPRY